MNVSIIISSNWLNISRLPMSVAQLLFIHSVHTLVWLLVLFYDQSLKRMPAVNGRMPLIHPIYLPWWVHFSYGCFGPASILHYWTESHKNGPLSIRIYPWQRLQVTIPFVVM